MVITQARHRIAKPKGTGFDGGTRSACLMRYPGQIKANTVSKKTLRSIDLLPTIASLTGAKLPDAQIDGKNVWDLVTNKSGASNPHEYYAFSTAAVFEGVMSGDGRWKLHLPHQYRVVASVGNGGAAGKYRQEQIELSLFDMQHDPLETTNVINKHPDVAARMKAFAEAHRAEFYPEQS